MHFYWDFPQKQGGIVARFSIGRSAPTRSGAVSAGTGLVDHSFGAPKPPYLTAKALLWVCGRFLDLSRPPRTTEMMHFFPTAGPLALLLVSVQGLWPVLDFQGASPALGWRVKGCSNSQQPSSRDWSRALGQHCLVVMAGASSLHEFNPEHPDQALSRDPRKLFHHLAHAKSLSSPPLFAHDMSNR